MNNDNGTNSIIDKNTCTCWSNVLLAFFYQFGLAELCFDRKNISVQQTHHIVTSIGFWLLLLFMKMFLDYCNNMKQKMIRCLEFVRTFVRCLIVLSFLLSIPLFLGLSFSFAQL